VASPLRENQSEHQKWKVPLRSYSAANVEKRSTEHCWAACLDTDRRSHSNVRWKKKKSALRAELIENAQEACVAEDDLQGEDEADKEVFSYVQYIYIFFFLLT
jgi:ethanolamine utilization protein EutQ (cupin superfamily)